MRCAAEEELSQSKEEVEEAEKQRGNRKRANRRSQRRRGRHRLKKNETAETANKGRKKCKEAEIVRHVESRHKDPPPVRLWWEKTGREGKVK